jgi:hypothetical protein
VWQKPADLATLHVAVGALTLVTTFTIAVRTMRLTAGTRVSTRAKHPRSDRAYALENASPAVTA